MQRKVLNISQLKHYFETIQFQVDVFSFDIFDTLLGRRIDPPEWVHQRVAALIADDYQDVTSEDIISIRYRVEKELREQALRDGFDYECHYDDIRKGIVEDLCGFFDESLAERIKQIEIGLEIDALVVKDGVPELLEVLKDSGKKLIAVSDMYLGIKEIQSLLHAKGLLGYFDHVYVSSETKTCKYSGRLFKKVSQDLGVDLDRIIHAGDNKVADYRSPLKLGMHAVLLRETEEFRRRSILKKYHHLGTIQDYWKGRSLLQISTCCYQKPREGLNDFYFKYGYEILGPIFSVYIQGVIEQIQKEKIGNIFFLARDGYLLEKIYNLMAPELMPQWFGQTTNSYLYLSRQSTAPAALRSGMDKQLALLALYNPKQQGLKSILKSFSLQLEDFCEIADRYGFDPIDAPITDWNDRRLLNFLNDVTVQKLMCKHGLVHTDLLYRYLDQNGFFANRKVAVIDIGWNGTIQYFLGQAFSELEECPHVYGHYFGYCGGIPYAFSEKNHIHGVFYDERRGCSSERAVMGFEEIFEDSCRACHASTSGYKLTETGEVVPVFGEEGSSDRLAEKSSDDYVLKLQEGIMAYVSEYLRAQRLTGYKFSEIKPFMVTLAERAIAFPRKNEVECLSRLSHSENWGHDNVMDLTEVRMDNFWLNIRKSLRTSNWRNGTVAHHAGIAGLFLFRVLDILRKTK